jgi:hypothetical protein
MERWIKFVSGGFFVIGLACIFISTLIVDINTKEILLGFGFALAPTGAFGFLTDWLVFGRLIKEMGEKTESLEKEINSLSVSTEFLRRSSDLGLEMIYTDRAAALKDFAEAMKKESQKEDDEGKLYIVGSSIKGLLENVKETDQIIIDALKSNIDLKLLLTHPGYSQYRENQEDRSTGAIEYEIFKGIRQLERCIENGHSSPPNYNLENVVRLYKGTPTCFMIVAGNRMLINPYPYEEEAYQSFCITVRKVEPQDRVSDQERIIYSQYLRAHFTKPWGRNAVPYRHYWLEGPIPDQTWDSDTCYGDVFVVQDAGSFYLAVYLNGQQKASVRGIPTSIPISIEGNETKYIDLPKEFTVKLFSIREAIWKEPNENFELLTIHPERRRGKASGNVDGNLGNDYCMLGLFDKEGKVENPNTHDDPVPEGLKGENLPLFYVSLSDKSEEEINNPPCETE